MALQNIKNLYVKVLIRASTHFAENRAAKIQEQALWCEDCPNAEVKRVVNVSAISKNCSNEKILTEEPILPPGIPDQCSPLITNVARGKETLSVVQNAVLKGLRPVIFSEGRAIKDSVFYKTSDGNEVRYRLRSQLKSNFQRPDKNLLNQFKKRIVLDKAILMFSQWNHYGHWVLEHLLKLRLLSEYLGEEAKQVKLIMEKHPAKWKLEVLSALGWDEKSIFPWFGNSLLVNQLFCPSYPKPRYSSYQWLRSELEKGFSVITPKIRKRRLYLSRSKYGSRSFSNESEVVEFLQAKGFEVFHPQEISVKDQIIAFQEAEVVVGPHGSAFTNVVFTENLKVIEIFGDIVGLGFYKYSLMMGHQYYPVFCPSGKSKNEPITVSVEALEDVCNQLGI